MRANLPVTQREYPFPPGQTLVSTTDPQGRILYCNETFIEVSGYTREELLGQPHNLIRHPDMPEEAFRDMWATIQSGRPWSAPVKNRRKDGDHYWVMANATPLMEDGRPVGYMSVRTEASRAQIDAAEALYATMRAEKSQGQRLHVFKEGRLVRATALGRLQEALRLGLGAKLLLSLVVLMVVAQLINLLLPVGGLWVALLNIAAQALVLGMVWRYLVQLITGPLAHLTDAANRLAACDLTHDVPRTRHDQLGDLEAALNQLAVNLRSVVGDARRQSDEVVQGVSEIAQGNLDLSQRTEAQASNLQQTAASMEEITGTVRQSADSAHRASTLMAGTHTTAERGKTAVNEVGQTMGAIQQASGRISEITQVIDSIAFQTNILALNAAVEAARAGELGKGFAVVAGEVRALAQRTSTAAKEIKQLIEESASTVAQGQGKTQAAQTTLADTVTGVSQMRTLVDEISHATGEQLNGISQINSAVAQLDTITQQNAALVEQVASSAQSVERLARATAATVAVFRLQDQRNPAPEQAVALRRQMKGQPAALALSH